MDGNNDKRLCRKFAPVNTSIALWCIRLSFKVPSSNPLLFVWLSLEHKEDLSQELHGFHRRVQARREAGLQLSAGGGVRHSGGHPFGGTVEIVLKENIPTEKPICFTAFGVTHAT